MNTAPPPVIYEMRTNADTPGQLMPISANTGETVTLSRPKQETTMSDEPLILWSYPGHRIVEAIRAFRELW